MIVVAELVGQRRPRVRSQIAAGQGAAQQGGRLLHGSGLALEWDKELGWVATEDTCEAWAAFEHARGVQLEQLAPRLVRLCREAAMWAERNEKPRDV